jgi:hypothetical protein
MKHRVVVRADDGLPGVADGCSISVNYPGLLLEMNPDGRARQMLENKNNWVCFPLPSPDDKHIA